MEKPKTTKTPISETTKKVAKTLGETQTTPLNTIERLVKVIGDERVLELLEEAQKMKTEGGLKTNDGSRQRTLGGVFFKIAKNKLSAQERWRVFTPKTPKKSKEDKQVQPMKWAELKPLLGQLLAAVKGEIYTVKMTLIGKPGRVIEKERVVLTSLQSAKSPSLPKGLPLPPSEPTTYLVFIAKKQWTKVKESIANFPEDKLIIEGYPVYDRRIGQNGALCVYAQNVTTKLIQQAKRQAQKDDDEG
ncbi:MAG: hypothetical protein KDJ52_13975 [Anaerolineae bacterium]|nr:hypothetical protein [Anaerolineae bacterium]